MRVSSQHFAHAAPSARDSTLALHTAQDCG
jgi:hypothetical protein